MRIRCRGGWRTPKVSLRGESSFDSFSYCGRIRRGPWLKTFDNLAIAANQELAKVPFDVARERGLLARQRNVERMPIRSVHVNFVEERECDIVLCGAELLDLLVGSRLLAHELI